MTPRHMTCQGCGNPEAYRISTVFFNGEKFETCDECGMESPLLCKDETERVLKHHIAPGKTRDRMVETHRKDRAEMEKKFSIKKGKVDPHKYESR